MPVTIIGCPKKKQYGFDALRKAHRRSVGRLFTVHQYTALVGVPDARKRYDLEDLADVDPLRVEIVCRHDDVTSTYRLSDHPIFNPEFGYTIKLFGVMGNHNQVVRFCYGCNLYIPLADDSALSFELGSDAGVEGSYGFVER